MYTTIHSTHTHTQEWMVVVGGVPIFIANVLTAEYIWTGTTFVEVTHFRIYFVKVFFYGVKIIVFGSHDEDSMGFVLPI